MLSVFFWILSLGLSNNDSTAPAIEHNGEKNGKRNINMYLMQNAGD